ncbi:hypothetical protein MKEN_01476400 [Mycena kentingensis (nom. inval.)]|nr:hypothetical protein MKEN_01476400 [Mycena kentingensis (nom. inval.)]
MRKITPENDSLRSVLRVGGICTVLGVVKYRHSRRAQGSRRAVWRAQAMAVVAAFPNAATAPTIPPTYLLPRPAPTLPLVRDPAGGFGNVGSAQSPTRRRTHAATGSGALVPDLVSAFSDAAARSTQSPNRTSSRIQSINNACNGFRRRPGLVRSAPTTAQIVEAATALPSHIPLYIYIFPYLHTVNYGHTHLCGAPTRRRAYSTI